MSKVYRSPYEAYPFLADPISDLRCDFELLTDRLASKTGMLRALCSEQNLCNELEKVCELIYHSNASLRTKVSIQPEEVTWLEECTYRLKEETAGRCDKFVLPQGGELGCLAHILRVDCKETVRLLYRHAYSESTVEPILFDFFNLLSGYFFMLSLKLNDIDGVEEVPFISRNY